MPASQRCFSSISGSFSKVSDFHPGKPRWQENRCGKSIYAPSAPTFFSGT
jgi:hypothetical protein